MKIIDILNKMATGELEEQILNNEIEVIEQNKEIEELSIDEIDNEVVLKNKINELVRAVNKLNKEREEK